MKTEELIEYYLVYTDNGIERVHWCNVNGVKELVSPKGKVYGYVPDYFEFERLQEENKKLQKQLEEAKEINAELVSKTDELVQKIHILNEQNTKQYNELCEEIKKNNILQKRLEIATKALNRICEICTLNTNQPLYIAQFTNRKVKVSLKEMEGVK